jgi:hypothetical protein
MNIITGADTGFQARGGRGALKKIAPSVVGNLFMCKATC